MYYFYVMKEKLLAQIYQKEDVPKGIIYFIEKFNDVCNIHFLNLVNEGKYREAKNEVMFYMNSKIDAMIQESKGL